MTPPALVPGATRQPLPYGLFSVFSFRPAGDGRWENGVGFEHLTCAPAEVLGPLDCEVLYDLSATEGNAMGESDPLTVVGHFSCSPVGWTQEQARARALEHLLVREEHAVEEALWTGSLGNSPALATASTTVLAPLPAATPDIKEAVGLLEQWLAVNYGSLGVIHMTRFAATVYGDQGGVASGGVLRTPLGTPIVAGGGYPGTGPAGEAITELDTWIYATPALFGYRTDVIETSGQVNDTFDRGINLMHAAVERTYVLGFDSCGAAAVLAHG